MLKETQTLKYVPCLTGYPQAKSFQSRPVSFAALLDRDPIAGSSVDSCIRE